MRVLMLTCHPGLLRAIPSTALAGYGAALPPNVVEVYRRAGQLPPTPCELDRVAIIRLSVVLRTRRDSLAAIMPPSCHWTRPVQLGACHSGHQARDIHHQDECGARTHDLTGFDSRALPVRTSRCKHE
jgi:hypothetical protein